MGYSIENPNALTSRRSQRLLRSGLFALATTLLAIASTPQAASAQAGIKEVSGAEVIRPTTSQFAEGPLRIYAPLAESLRNKGVNLVADSDDVVDNLLPVTNSGTVRSLLLAGGALMPDTSATTLDSKGE